MCVCGEIKHSISTPVYDSPMLPTLQSSDQNVVPICDPENQKKKKTHTHVYINMYMCILK